MAKKKAAALKTAAAKVSIKVAAKRVVVKIELPAGMRKRLLTQLIRFEPKKKPSPR